MYNHVYRMECDFLVRTILSKHVPPGVFIYRRPTLYPLEIAVDFLKSL
jgi:hypothetical protein